MKVAQNKFNSEIVLQLIIYTTKEIKQQQTIWTKAGRGDTESERAMDI